MLVEPLYATRLPNRKRTTKTRFIISISFLSTGRGGGDIQSRSKGVWWHKRDQILTPPPPFPKRSHYFFNDEQTQSFLKICYFPCFKVKTVFVVKGILHINNINKILVCWNNNITNLSWNDCCNHDYTGTKFRNKWNILCF